MMMRTATAASLYGARQIRRGAGLPAYAGAWSDAYHQGGGTWPGADHQGGGACSPCFTRRPGPRRGRLATASRLSSGSLPTAPARASWPLGRPVRRGQDDPELRECRSWAVGMYLRAEKLSQMDSSNLRGARCPGRLASTGLNLEQRLD